MKFLYLDNFRGFKNTLIEIDQVSFFVGENSTGKSSALKVLKLFSQQEFWFAPNTFIKEDVDFLNFKDLVSASSADKKSFTLGYIGSKLSEPKDDLVFSIMVLEFKEKDGSPELYKIICCIGEKLYKFVLGPKRTKFKILDITPLKAENVEGRFNSILEDDKIDSTGFTNFDENLPRDLPMPIMFSMASNTKPDEYADFLWGSRYYENVSWIAPIRSKPQKFYGGSKTSFSPEGSHTPYILKKKYGDRIKSKKFADKLINFGKDSGLFEAVVPHSFSKSPHSPFELHVTISNKELNINNVGYGISQVLPLVVDFLSAQKPSCFAVQQPEVHLHPKAQASLGGLIYEMSSSQLHSFYIETHSDYLIDRFRFAMSKSTEDYKIISSVLFFYREAGYNKVKSIQIDKNGKYSPDQPRGFKDFFLQEEMRMLEV
jgi:hypothetical protein